MPKYLVERDFGHMTDEQYQEVVERAKLIFAEATPDVAWNNTHVCSGEGGTTKAYCVYEAPSADRVQDHIERVGAGELMNILEIVGTMTPDGAIT